MQRIVVLVPNKTQLTTAGVRIRYDRLKPELARKGHELEVAVIDEVRLDKVVSGDIYLVSKCSDPRSVMLARSLRGKGCKLGIDLFDDYFSQTDDSRLVHRRQWFGSILPSIDFITCATPTMAGRLAGMGVEAPVHVVNDPFDNWNAEGIAVAVASKLDQVRRERLIRVCWFGMGRNDFFPVGLDDLFAFSDMLARLRRTGLRVHLDILTNARALTPDILAKLARLPVPYAIQEWSLSLEAQCLGDSYVAFIPVNGQPFSTVKSMNRAITALTHGTQVLTCGHDLYRALDRFLYTSPAELLEDVEGGSPRVSGKVIGDLDETLKALADPGQEAQALVSFLDSVPIRQDDSLENGLQGILHGFESAELIHDFAKALGFLSIGSPVSAGRKGLDFAVATEHETGAPVLVPGKAVMAALSSDAQGRLKSVTVEDGRQISALPLPGWFRQADRKSPARLAAHYGATMAAYGAILQDVLPGLTLFPSEARSPLRVRQGPDRAASSAPGLPESMGAGQIG